jgi:hypothetical protein
VACSSEHSSSGALQSGANVSDWLRRV